MAQGAKKVQKRSKAQRPKRSIKQKPSAVKTKRVKGKSGAVKARISRMGRELRGQLIQDYEKKASAKLLRTGAVIGLGDLKSRGKDLCSVENDAAKEVLKKRQKKRLLAEKERILALAREEMDN